MNYEYQQLTKWQARYGIEELKKRSTTGKGGFEEALRRRRVQGEYHQTW
jgi:hypothetical protein